MRTHQPVQRDARHAELTRRIGKTAAMTQQRLLDRLPFGRFPRLGERDGRQYREFMELEIGRGNHPALRHHDRAAHAIDQLAHVARPRIAVQRGNRVRREAAQPTMRIALETLEHVTGEHLDVLAARA